MDHSVLIAPTLFDLVRYVYDSLKIEHERVRFDFILVQDRFVGHCLIHDFPLRNIAIMVLVLCFVIFACHGDGSSAGALIFLLQHVLKRQKNQLRSLINKKTKILAMLERLELSACDLYWVDLQVDENIKSLFEA